MGIRFFFYLIPPLLAYFLILNHLSHFSLERLREDLGKKQIFHLSPKEVLSFLPSTFEEHPHLAAISLRNKSGNLLGSVHLASRLQDFPVQIFLKEKYTQKIQVAHDFYVYVLTEENYDFSFLVKEKTLWLDALKLLPKIYPDHWLYLIAYFVVGFFSYFVYSHKKKKKLSFKKETKVSTKDSLNFSVSQAKLNSFAVNIQTEIWHFVEEVRKNIPIEKAQLFLKEKKEWKPCLHIHGKILVKGNLAEVTPEVLAKEDFDHPLTNENQEELFIPLRVEGELLGALWLKKSTAFSNEEIYQIFRLAKPLSLEIQRYLKLEKALFDSETGFYQKNYLLLLLKERFFNQNSYYIAGFTIKNFEQISQKKLRSWAKNLLYLLSAKSPKVEIFRLDINSFALLFSSQDCEDKVKETLQEISKLTEKELSLFVRTFIVKSPASLAQLNRFFQNLLYSLHNENNQNIPVSYPL